jgi:signal transduction histidine kinase
VHPLDEVIKEALSSATRAHRNATHVQVKSLIDCSVSAVLLDPQLMHLALLNVMSNALQAMPDGGELNVTARAVRTPDRPWAEITIADTGEGIPAHALGKVFEPFFTSRASGTGLGLAIVKRIVDSHMGQVEVASTPGMGATVAIRLPLQA